MKSSWIQSISYKKLDDGSSYLALFLKDQDKKCPSCGGRGYVPPDDSPRRRSCFDFNRTSRPCHDCFRRGTVQVPTALLYGGPDSPIPSWLPGVMSAWSPGRAYNRLLKGKYPSQRIEGTEKVQELKEMMS